MTLPLQANLLHLPYAPAMCVQDSEIKNLIDDAIFKSVNEKCFDSNEIIPEFLKSYKHWIANSRTNDITGIDDFQFIDFSAGTTESFDKFYIRYAKKRIVTFRGEYLYHKKALVSSAIPYQEIENVFDLKQGDALIISQPFADTGKEHYSFKNGLLDHCLENQIPVLLDCAYFGICQGINLHIDHPAVEQAVFSLSKTFPVNLLRVGIRFSKKSLEDGLTAYNLSHYVNKLGASVGKEILKTLDSDQTFTSYRSRQLEICDKFQLEPSDTVIFGIDFNNKYPQYNRGSLDSNRICFSKFLKDGHIPEKF